MNITNEEDRPLQEGLITYRGEDVRCVRVPAVDVQIGDLTTTIMWASVTRIALINSRFDNGAIVLATHETEDGNFFCSDVTNGTCKVWREKEDA